jgi:hypothetical protein
MMMNNDVGDRGDGDGGGGGGGYYCINGINLTFASHSCFF